MQIGWLIGLTVLVQIIITYGYTNSKHFSIRALIRNLSIALAIFFAVKTQKWWIVMIPLLLEILIETLKFNGFHFEKYIATEYQYNDYWREVVKANPILSNFTEANYDSIFGLNTRDRSSENIKRIDDWCRHVYAQSLKEKGTHVPGTDIDLFTLKKRTDDAKFELLLSKYPIHSGMRILEIGFGEGDFMNYIYEHYGIRPVGVSLANEQVELVKSRGFEAHTMDSWDMTPEVLGTYDLIIQCGNLEYIMCSGEDPQKVYTKYCAIINRLLNPGGKYVITCIHINEHFGKWRISDYMHCYFLWSGNDGHYPLSSDGFSKYANTSGLLTKYREDRTNDYYIASALFFSSLQCSSGQCNTSYNTYDVMKALIKTIAGPYFAHTYACYMATSSYEWQPFMWEFIPQKKEEGWVSPVTLQYIWFEKG